jgi:5'-nucleotidase
MKAERRIQILLTNDDGINSPGIWAAAEALSELGFVTVAAPREQASSSGRSLPPSSDGKIEARMLPIGEQQWQVYAIGGTPAQAVLHTLLELMPDRPDLVVSGINYGENVGQSITISGTVGAAMEGAAMGIPSMAVSLQLEPGGDYFGNSHSVDFSTAAYFTKLMAKMLLEKQLPAEVDLIKVEVPMCATPETGWRITRLARQRYYHPVAQRKGGLDSQGYIGAEIKIDYDALEKDSDIHTLVIDKMVAITPISLDMTARVDLGALEQSLRKH